MLITGGQARWSEGNDLLFLQSLGQSFSLSRCNKWDHPVAAAVDYNAMYLVCSQSAKMSISSGVRRSERGLLCRWFIKGTISGIYQDGGNEDILQMRIAQT